MAPKKIKNPTKNDLVEIALELSASLGWSNISLSDVAEKAGISLAELHDHFDDKSDILVALGRMIDRSVLENMGAPDPEGSVRDALIDVMMERFDALNGYRDGIIAILKDFRFAPQEALMSCPHLFRSMGWMLEAAGVDTNGVRGCMKIMGLTAVYLKVLKVWKEDDSPDLGKVMAALDKDLGQAERFANSLGF